jgi:hypothetical protein
MSESARAREHRCGAAVMALGDVHAQCSCGESIYAEKPSQVINAFVSHVLEASEGRLSAARRLVESDDTLCAEIVRRGLHALGWRYRHPIDGTQYPLPMDPIRVEGEKP